jgi:hypothetical protein
MSDNKNPWPGYNEYLDVELDETDPEVREELFATMRFMGDKPEAIVTDPEFRKDYAEYLKKHPQVEKDDGQEKP